MNGQPSTSPVLELEAVATGIQRFRFAAGEVAASSQRSPHKEGPNEDALAIIPCGQDLVLAVADGVGGCPNGHLAAQIMVTTLAERLQAPPGPEEELRNVLIEVIEHANERVLELGSGSATTVALVAIQGEWAQSIHVGDSPILITGQRGRVRYQSIPHSPTGYAEASGIIIEEDDPEWYREHRHLVSNIVGSREMRIEIGPRVRLRPRDTVLLASDGLSDNLLSEEMVEAARKGALGRAAERLIHASAARMQSEEPGWRGHPDDLTLILFRPAR